MMTSLTMRWETVSSERRMKSGAVRPGCSRAAQLWLEDDRNGDQHDCGAVCQQPLECGQLHGLVDDGGDQGDDEDAAQ